MHDRAVSSAVGILVVDDEVSWTKVMADCLRPEQVLVVVADNGEEVLAAAKNSQPRIVVLDMDLPGVDTLSVCRRLSAMSDAYIIMVTRCCDEATTVAGLAAGADDVLTKPFTGREVAARIRAVLRRHRRSRRKGVPPPSGSSFGRWVFGPLSVDVGRREVFVAEEQIDLTRTQFEILATLAQRAGAVTSRQELLNSVWGPYWSGSPSNIDVHIGQLRKRLGDDPARPVLILNVRGKGYRLVG